MAIKVRDQVKWTDSGSSLELEADTGEAFLVKDIYVEGATGVYTEITIDKTTVGYFRTDAANLGNHLHFPLEDQDKYTLLKYLWNKGIFKGYPVAEGQTFIVNPGTAMAIAIIYDIYEAGDIAPDAENGSEASEYLLINYGRKATSGTLSDGDNEYIVSMLPSEFPDFPYGKVVPAKTQISIYGILATDVGKTTGGAANKQGTEYIKLIKEREVLFDEDKRGLLLKAEVPTSDNAYIGKGISVVGNYSSMDRRLPLMFEEPLIFAAGEELTVIMHTDLVSGSATISTNLGEVAVIEKVLRTS